MTTKSLLSICVWCSVPVFAAAIPPSDQARRISKPQPTRPTGNINTPSLSQGVQRPQVPGFGRSTAGSYNTDAHRQEQASLLPGGVNYRPANSRPGGNRPGPAYNRPNNNYINRPDVVVNRPDININRPTINRPTVNVNRPVTNINNTTVNNTVVNNNTTVINQNYGNQNFHNRPNYRPNYGNNYGYNYGGYRPPRDYYPHLHNHWQPAVWSAAYSPAYYNYTYRVGAAGGGVMSFGVTNYAFANPFYVRPTTTVVAYDYSQPLRVPPPDYRETDDDLIRSERAIRRFDDAREVFRRGEYGRANELIDEAIEILPSDPNLHQFRSLVLFARKKYPDAAAALYSVLAVSPGWTTATIAKLYDDPKEYLSHVKELEEFVRSNQRSYDAQFLLAYHEMIKGELRLAQRLLENVQRANSNDRVVANLLTALRDAAPAPTERTSVLP